MANHKQENDIQPRIVARRRSLWLVVTVFGVLLLGTALYLASTKYQVSRIERHLYADNLRLQVSLPAMPAPRAADRILIVAPHPDDETIGFGGYIRQALAVGAHIHIVTITNGDLRGKLPGMDTRKKGLPPSVFIRVGYLRQQESLSAIRMLGLAPDVDTFLGYPNGPIMDMWQPEHWLAANPVLNNRTQSSRSPYSNSLSPGVVYCGEALVQDLETVMRREAPSILFNLDPNEQHADHIGASAFTSYAFNELRAGDVPFTRTCQVYYYLVHHQCWPAPMAYLPDSPLYPPAPLYRLFPSQWLSLPLTREQTLLTHRALENFASQGGVTSPVLAALPRRNELFRRIPDEHWPSNLSVPLHLVVLDPPADNVGSTLHPDADIVQLLLGRDHNRLLVNMRVRGKVTASTHCTLSLHCGGASPACRRIISYNWQMHQTNCWTPLGSDDDAVLTTDSSGHTLQLIAPWPFADDGPLQTKFFQISATTSSGKEILNQTMTQTVVM